MKKMLLIALLIHLAVSGFAQNTIKFLGIPIEGTKKEMIAKLQAKGYQLVTVSELAKYRNSGMKKGKVYFEF